MKIKFYITILLITILFTAKAQSNYYYYYKGEKVYLTLDSKKVFLTTNTSFQESTIQNLGIESIQLQTDINTKNGEVEYNSEQSTIDFSQKYSTLLNNPEIRNVSLYFKRGNGDSIGTSNIFYIKLNNETDLNSLQQTANQKDVTIVHQNQFMPLWYKLSVNANNPKTSLQLSNEFFETGLFADVDPAFMFDFKQGCANDDDFDQLWGLSNTTDPNLDISACEAWGITEGNGINVAVVDNGIYKEHNDLNSNISPLSYDANSGTSPSVYISDSQHDHGTHVAGTIAAIKDNNLQVVGVAPQAKLMSVSHDFEVTTDISEEFADGINWAWQNGADVINNSWSDQGGTYYDIFQSAVLENAILNAINLGRDGLGTVVVFVSGNASGTIGYPGNFHEDILCVGAMRQSGSRANFSGYGTNLDVVAPGKDILLIKPPQTTVELDDTSFAAPHVTGIAALVLSANPNLTSLEVNEIIESTAKKVGTYTYTNYPNRPNGTWHEEMGYGLVDAYDAVLLAQSLNPDDLDLYIKDSADDDGTEPNTVTQHMWTSQDIWVRNYNDDGLTHQNPEYSADLAAPNWIYVRVINRGTDASLGTETLTVNWAKANTALEWPQNWDGSLQNSSGHPLGGQFLFQIPIPILQPNESTIVKIPWFVPNPENYLDGAGSANPWHFCLLATIHSEHDPMGDYTTNPNIMVRNNNNQAWKNLTVVDLVDDGYFGMVMVSNNSNYPRTFYLEMQKETNEGGKAIFDEAEVVIEMDNVLFDAWERGGEIVENLDPTSEENRKLVKGDNVILDNFEFNPNERGLLTLDFNFLTKELTEKDQFTYHIIQKDANTDEVIGGETFLVQKNPRLVFLADAGGDKEVDLNETITITAEDINEPAEYNWYDSEGNLVYQGQDLAVTADVAKAYQLEVISTNDGFKDYTDVNVRIKPSVIESIAPNPASNNITTVNYKINEAQSAYLMVVGYYGGSTSNNYILDIDQSSIHIDLSSYQLGYYTVALVCDGTIVDAKTLIKE